MGHINEPAGVTFTVVNKRLTEADKKLLSAHIQKLKEQQIKKRKRKKTTT